MEFAMPCTGLVVKFLWCVIAFYRSLKRVKDEIIFASSRFLINEKYILENYAECKAVTRNGP